MNIEEILSQLKSEDSTFPRKALKAAISQREEITPHLLKIIENVNHDSSELLNRERDLSLIYAMFLLAQFREPSAYPLIVTLVSKNEQVVEDLLGDLVTEDLGRMLASVYDGRLELIQELIENHSLYEYVRTAAIKCLTILVAHKLLPREVVINYFRLLFNSKLKKDGSYVWTSLVCESTNLCPKELEIEIRKTFEADLIEPFFINLKDVEKSLKTNINQSLSSLRKNRHYSLINNTIAEIEGWACFKHEPSKKTISTEEVAPSFSGLFKKTNTSNKKLKKSQNKKKGFG